MQNEIMQAQQQSNEQFLLSILNETLRGTKQKQLTKEQQIVEVYSKVDDTIEQLNNKLINHFKQHQRKILEQYKQQLMNAQKQLTNLRNYTNEQQIKTKIRQRKQILQQQRKQLIDNNMIFSNKCELYKKKLSMMILEGKQLQNQIHFLDQQILRAHQKQILLKDQKKSFGDELVKRNFSKSQLPVFTAHKFKTTPIDEIIHNTTKKQQTTNIIKEPKMMKSMSTHNKIRKTLTYSGAQQQYDIKTNKSIKNPKIVQSTNLQKVFEQCVHKIRSKKKQKKMMSIIKGQQFTNYEKKMIMAQFLSEQVVKKKIYDMLFETNNYTQSQQLSDNKVRISFEDVSV